MPSCSIAADDPSQMGIGDTQVIAALGCLPVPVYRDGVRLPDGMPSSVPLARMALPEWVRAGAIRSDGEVQEAVHRRPQGIVGTDLHEALAISRRQQATFWKLRAAMSLSRLWQRQGKRQAVHQLLAEVYGGFTEGLDTADVRKAKVLLDELEA